MRRQSIGKIIDKVSEVDGLGWEQVLANLPSLNIMASEIYK